jgi:hypothetical protein
MVKAPGILGVVAFSYGFLGSGCLFEKIAVCGSAHRRVGAAEGCDLLIFRSFASTRLVGRMLQTEFLFAFDLYHLGVVHGDFHRAKAQIAQCALDFTQNGGFVLPVNTA